MTFKKRENVWYIPEFTFHTCRYMEIAGLDEAPEIFDIKGIALNTRVEADNNFASSSKLDKLFRKQQWHINNTNKS
ncbi:MAG: hypothetical protein GY705_28760 [Bacteroidetes bacterium]|nr:hypothetical protein [Bacteroidota bacterium]